MGGIGQDGDRYARAAWHVDRGNFEMYLISWVDDCLYISNDGKGTVVTASVPTARNLADGFTKAVDENTVKDHRFHIHGMDQPHRSTETVLRPVPNPTSKIKPVA